MPTCSFCKRSYKHPHGLTIFTFDGKSLHFCSSKCRRNLALKRDPRKTSWVKKGGHFQEYLSGGEAKEEQVVSNNNNNSKEKENKEK